MSDYKFSSAPILTIDVSGISVTLTWNAVSGATGYTLFYAHIPIPGPRQSKGLIWGPKQVFHSIFGIVPLFMLLSRQITVSAVAFISILSILW